MWLVKSSKPNIHVDAYVASWTHGHDRTFIPLSTLTFIPLSTLTFIPLSTLTTMHTNMGLAQAGLHVDMRQDTQVGGERPERKSIGALLQLKDQQHGVCRVQIPSTDPGPKV